MSSIRIHVPSVLAGVGLAASAFLLMGQQTGAVVPAQPCLTPQQQRILAHMSIVSLDDGQGGMAETIRFSNVNVQIVDGSGATDSATGRGNLIVGYNEFGNPNGDDRTGSHNIVTGFASTYSSFAGIIGGHRNAITGPCASAPGGNTNVASGIWSSVSGGSFNEAPGIAGSVLGGEFNQANGIGSTVSGGEFNHANGLTASISGGEFNTADGNFSFVCGGEHNTATGDFSVLGGGRDRETFGGHDWAAGALLEDE